MPDPHSKPGRVWTVAEAKARLSEVLRLSEEEGPQHIGRRRSFVVVSAADWGCEDAAPPAARAVAGRPHAARREPRSSRGPEVGEGDSLRRRRGGRRVGLKGFLLDTSVVSEVARDAPGPAGGCVPPPPGMTSCGCRRSFSTNWGWASASSRRGAAATASAPRCRRSWRFTEDRILPLGRGGSLPCRRPAGAGAALGTRARPREMRSSPERRARTTSRLRPGISAISRVSNSTWWIRGRRGETAQKAFVLLGTADAAEARPFDRGIDNLTGDGLAWTDDGRAATLPGTPVAPVK